MNNQEQNIESQEQDQIDFKRVFECLKKHKK